MESIYYSMIGIIALLVHLVINHDMFSKFIEKDNPTIRNFHTYSICVLCYFLSDLLWGIFDYMDQTKLIYIDTVFYYITMGLSVVFCCNYIISFLKLNATLSRILKSFGICFCVAEFSALIVNFFIPIFFFFDEAGNYQAGSYRHLALLIQIFMFADITLISGIVTLKKSVLRNRRNITIFLSSGSSLFNRPHDRNLYSPCFYSGR